MSLSSEFRAPAPVIRSRVLGAILLSFASLSAPAAWANVGEFYGYGSRGTALGGAGVADGFEGYASFYNPAALPRTGFMTKARPAEGDPEDRLILTYALVYLQPSFHDITNVTVENEYTSDLPPAPAAQFRRGNVATDYRATTGQIIGASYALSNTGLRPTLGATLFLPIEAISYIDTGETFTPEYALYRARTQRPQVDGGLGLQLLPELSLGIGFHVGYGLTSNANGFITTDTTKSSRIKVSAALKPKVGAYYGALFDPSEYIAFGAVFRHAVKSPGEMKVNTAAQIGGVIAGVDANFTALSSIYYDPLSVELGTAIRIPTEAVRANLLLQVDYQRWGKFEPPTLQIQPFTLGDCTDDDGSGTGDSCEGLPVSPTRTPNYPFRNIWVPRAGLEVQLGAMSIRLGYTYKPSIMSETPNGAGNLLDPSRHSASAGFGYRFQRFLHFETPLNVDIHASYHALVTQQITKTPGDEAGDATSEKIGAPGYEAGGKILGGGLSLTLEI